MIVDPGVWEQDEVVRVVVLLSILEGHLRGRKADLHRRPQAPDRPYLSDAAKLVAAENERTGMTRGIYSQTLFALIRVIVGDVPRAGKRADSCILQTAEHLLHITRGRQ